MCAVNPVGKLTQIRMTDKLWRLPENREETILRVWSPQSVAPPFPTLSAFPSLTDVYRVYRLCRQLCQPATMSLASPCLIYNTPVIRRRTDADAAPLIRRQRCCSLCVRRCQSGWKFLGVVTGKLRGGGGRRGVAAVARRWRRPGGCWQGSGTLGTLLLLASAMQPRKSDSVHGNSSSGESGVWGWTPS